MPPELSQLNSLRQSEGNLHVVILAALEVCCQSGAGDFGERIRGVEDTPLFARRSSIPRQGGIETEEGHLRGKRGVGGGSGCRKRARITTAA